MRQRDARLGTQHIQRQGKRGIRIATCFFKTCRNLLACLLDSCREISRLSEQHIHHDRRDAFVEVGSLHPVTQGAGGFENVGDLPRST